MASKNRLSLQDACQESDNEESYLKIDSDDSLNEHSSEKINLPELIKNFDEEQAVFRNSVFLPPTLPTPTTAYCVLAPATTEISFVPDEADSVSTISTVTVKSTPKRPQKRKKSATTVTNYYFLLDFFHEYNFEHIYNLLITSCRVIS